MKSLIKKLIPKSILNIRHLFYAWYGAAKYRYPSEELLVIGVTGTSGKSSTCHLLKQLLEACGKKVGVLSTVEFCVAGDCQLNDKKMTMLGKMEIQKYLRKMVDAGCDVAIIETTSEGYVQYRHRFINYDIMMLTNLYPEHIDAHGSFENYKAAKVGIFEYVSRCKTKDMGQKNKIAIVNGDSEYAKEFLVFPFNQKITFGKENVDVQIKNLDVDADGMSFTIDEYKYHPKLYGAYQAMNIAAVVAVAKSMQLGEREIQKAVNDFQSIPGRIEFIKEAEERGFQVIVDYAFEPVAIMALYDVVRLLQPKRIIHVFGSTGGGRDVQRRFTVGAFVGKHADICIITDEDPYDDDPQVIINDVAGTVEKAGKRKEKNFWTILDRQQAIQAAVDMAHEGDLILVTGKGSEQAMVIKGELVPWDDRGAVRKAIRRKP